MNMKKIIALFLIAHSAFVFAPFVDLKTKSSSPLLYNMVDIRAKNVYFAVSPFGGRSFDGNHIAEALTMNGQSYFTLNEQGAAGALEVSADMNPIWMDLTSVVAGGAALGSYNSSVSLKPELKTAGALLHFYVKSDSFFFDVRSAVVQNKTNIVITETGGGDGVFNNIESFADAMVNSDWSYGRMGVEQKKTGLDNIQVKLGFVTDFDMSETTTLMGYLLAEIPTGKASNSEWVFEPRVGKNHFGIGLGFDEYYVKESDQIMVGVNWRYFFGAKEKRSFDLKNKPWSRYMRVITIPSTGAAQGTAGSGINYFTVDGTVTPGSQVNAYLRYAHTVDKLRVEIGYNFFFKQKEKISDLVDFANEFGIRDLYAMNHRTLNTANIKTQMVAALNSNTYSQDPGEAIAKTDLDLDSGAALTQMVSSLAARLEYVGESARFGIGGSVDGAHTRSSYAAWNLWANVGVLF